MEIGNTTVVEDSKLKWKFMDEFWFKVQFVLKSNSIGPEVREVYLAGDFNTWKLQDLYRMSPCNDGYSITLLLSQGYYQYKFVLLVPLEGENSEGLAKSKEGVSVIADEVEPSSRGSETITTLLKVSDKFKQVWITDPSCPYVGGVHNNSIMFVHMDPKVYGLRNQNPPHRDYHRPGSDGSEFQTFCPPLPPDIEAQGTLQRLIFVYLPPSYYRDETRRYPVLYANDGEALFSTPSHAGGPCKGGFYLDEKLDYFWEQNLLPEFILVGVPNSDFVCNGNRTLEYCTSVFHDTSRDPYKRYLVEVVKKEVDIKYRTLPDSDNCVIMGGSMGGLCAFVYCLNHPDIFSSAVCISSSFWYVDKHNKTAYDLLRSHSGQVSNSEVDGNSCIKPCEQEESSSISSKSDSFVSASNSFPDEIKNSQCPSLAVEDFITPNFRPRIYIDSGDGPGDNCYETKEMNSTFLECGWKEGEEFKYVLDECAKKTEDGITHLEAIWKERILPALQFAFKFTAE